jgi:DnaJ-class molecular chaperone
MLLNRSTIPQDAARPPLTCPCPVCVGTGDHSTDDGHRANRKDTCATCGGEGVIDAATGRRPETSFRADDLSA